MTLRAIESGDSEGHSRNIEARPLGPWEGKMAPRNDFLRLWHSLLPRGQMGAGRSCSAAEEIFDLDDTHTPPQRFNQSTTHHRHRFAQKSHERGKRASNMTASTSHEQKINIQKQQNRVPGELEKRLTLLPNHARIEKREETQQKKADKSKSISSPIGNHYNTTHNQRVSRNQDRNTSTGRTTRG